MLSLGSGDTNFGALNGEVGAGINGGGDRDGGRVGDAEFSCVTSSGAETWDVVPPEAAT